MLEIAHGFEVGVGRGSGGAQTVEDFGAESGDDARVPREFVEDPGQCGGGGVAAGEEDGDELVPDNGPVAREGGEGVQEGVAAVGFCFLFEFLRGEA